MNWKNFDRIYLYGYQPSNNKKTTSYCKLLF